MSYTPLNSSGYKPELRESGWGVKIRAFIDAVNSQVQSLWSDKAPASHSHGAGGTVVSRGSAASRPASGELQIYINTDDYVVELVSGAGDVISTLCDQKLAYFLGD